MKRFLKRLLLVLLVVAILLTAGIYIFFTLGSRVTENIDTYVYSLPYKEGTSHRVVQGYGGLFSHKHIAAIDFAMDPGTPVHAAREGVVYAFKDDSDEGGPWPKYNRKANFIMIKHPDGSYGCYWHLRKNGVVTKSGPVAKGQLIGYSGTTGFVLRPHLHFSVKRVLNYEMDSYVRTLFKTSGGVQLLKRGRSYKNE